MGIVCCNNNLHLCKKQSINHNNENLDNSDNLIRKINENTHLSPVKNRLFFKTTLKKNVSK